LGSKLFKPWALLFCWKKTPVATWMGRTPTAVPRDMRGMMRTMGRDRTEAVAMEIMGAMGVDILSLMMGIVAGVTKRMG
jgi:hypothetical protein